MEFIKKTVLQAVTTGTTTGCTGTCRIIIPNTGVTYYFKIGLVQEAHDWGFFDAYIAPPLTKLTVITSIFTSVTKTTASGGGNVLADGGKPVTDRGIVYSINPNPTTGNTTKHSGTGLGTFVSNISGLTIDTLYYVRAYAKNADGLVYGDEMNFKTLALTSLITKSITGITTSGATSGGEIASDGGNPIIRRGIVWGIDINPTISNNYTINGYGIGSYNSQLINLTTLTTYYVRAYVTNVDETTYGNQISFTTIGLPTVATNAMSSVGATTATGSGNVISEGGVDVTEKGIVWSTSPSPTIANNKVADGTGLGIYTGSITGLLPTSTYYVRAYAINSVGISYGNEVSFSTINVPTVTTATITSIQATTAIGGGNVTSDGGGTVTSRGVQFGTASGAYSRITIDGSGIGSFASNLGSLSPTTQYFVRAYATNSAGTGYGSEVNFATIAVTPPIVTTIYALDITMVNAIIRAGVAYIGSHTIDERGVVWATYTNPDQSSNKQINNGGDNTGYYDTLIAGLVPNQLYYVRAYAHSVEDGYIYGNQISLTTLPAVAPTLGVFTVTDIASNNANGNSSVTSDGGATVYGRGFVWSTSPSPTTANSKVTSGTGTGAFSSNMWGLTFNTTYYARAYASNSAGITYSNEVSFTSLPIAPVVSTQMVYSIGTNYATGAGTIESNGGALVTSRGFVMGITSGNYPNHIDAGNGDGSFYANLGPFVANTTYYVKACATNSIGTGYGGEVSFTSLPVQPPSVQTIYVLSLAMTTATIRAGVAYTGSHVITERGIVWGTYQMPDQSSSKQTNNSGNNIGVFDTAMTGLQPNQLYYVRAYAYTAEEGYIYGNQISLTTLAPLVPTLGTFSISSILYNSAIGSGSVTDDGGATVYGRGIVWNTTPSPTTANNKVTSGTGTGAFTGVLGILYYNTTYYARAYASNSAGITYSNEVSFTTSPIAPVVSTQGVNSVTPNSAAGNGIIVDNGGSTITAEGFMLGTNPNYINGNIPVVTLSFPTFSSGLGALVASTTYYMKAYATNAVGTSYGDVITFTTPAALPPSVQTAYVLSITYNSATIRAGVSYNGSHVVDVRGVVWATYQMPDQSSNNQTNNSGNNIGVFDTTITGLASNQLYYVRAYAHTAEDGYIYGNQISFTSGLPSAPTVTTTALVTIGETTASGGGGNVSDDGGAFVSARGIVYSTSPNPTVANSKTTNGSGTGAFNSVLSSLASSTQYYYRAYASNSAGAGYGSESTFTTLTPPPYVCVIVRTNTLGCKVGGLLKLYKADGTLQYSKTAFPPATEQSFCDNSVNASCSYYVDYSGMGMYTSSNSPSTCSGLNWNINNISYGTTVHTLCFTPNSTVCGCIY